MPLPSKTLRNESVVMEFRRGIPPKAIAKRHGISKNRVLEILHRAGVTIQRRRT